MESPRDPARRVDLGGPDLLARLHRWLGEAAADEAVASRQRERWLRRAADEEATFAGVLLDLGERGAPVVITGRGGRRHRGVVRAVGLDFCGLRLPDGTDVLLPFAGIASVRSEPGAEPAAGDRTVDVGLALGLAEAVAAVAEDRPRVLVVTMADADGLAGELRTVGQDVAVVRLDGADRSTVYVQIGSIAELRLA